jgi:hypothetical protein
MSQQLAKSPDVIELTPDNLTALMQHPLRAVPRELRPAVWNVWVQQQHLFPAPLSISAAIASDLARGLTIADAAVILDAMTHPEERAKFKFATDFSTEMARRIGIALKQREKETKAAELRGPEIDPVEKSIVKDLIGNYAKTL